MGTDKKAKKKLSLSSQILIAMGLGIGAGVFFGEYCAFLKIFGQFQRCRNFSDFLDPAHAGGPFHAV